MTAPLDCIPNCCGCIVCDSDNFDRPISNDVNAGLTPPRWTGDTTGFSIVANVGNDHALSSNIDNAYLIWDADLIVRTATPNPPHANTANIYCELEILGGMANNTDIGILNSYLTPFAWYGAKVHKVNATTFDFELLQKTGGGPATILASQSGFPGGVQRQWLVLKVDFSSNEVSMWFRYEDNTVSTKLTAVYTDNGGTRVGIGGGRITTPIIADNFKWCEDHCPCSVFKDDFDRADNADINANNSPIVWDYSLLPAGRKWQILTERAWLQNGTNGTLNPSSWRDNGAAIQGTQIKFTASAETPGTAITFGFSFGGGIQGTFTLTFGTGYIVTGTYGTLVYGDGLQNGGGPKPATMKVPIFAGSSLANITLCINEHYGQLAMKCSVGGGSGNEISVKLGTAPGPKPWRYTTTGISVSGNASNGGVYINNYSVSDTFDAGFKDSPKCPKCDPQPCYTCTVVLPNTGTANPCGTTYRGTWTAGVATTPAAVHSISFNKAYAYGYTEILWDFTPVAGDEISFSGFAGKLIRINVISPTFACIEYIDSSIKQIGSINPTGSQLFTITVTEYGVFVGAIHSHQLGQMPTDKAQTASQTLTANLHSASYFKVHYIKYGRGATGYHPRHEENVFAGEAPYCYSVLESCDTITDWAAADPYNKQPALTPCVQVVSGGGEWWTCQRNSTDDFFFCGDDEDVESGYPIGTYGLNTWSANTWWIWPNFPVDYPTPNPGPDDSIGQTGAFMVFNFYMSSNYGGGVAGIHGVGIQPEVRISWNGGAGYLAIRQSKSPNVDSTVYLEETQPPCFAFNTAESYFEMIPVGLGLPATPIKFKMSGSGGDGVIPFHVAICVGGGSLRVSVSNLCFPYFPLIIANYSGEVTKWRMGTGNIDSTEWTPGATQSRDHASMSIGAEYNWANRPENVYDAAIPNDCVDCYNAHPTTICPTRGTQIKKLKVVITGTVDNTRAWSSPDCNGGVQVGSCSHYDRIIILENQNRMGLSQDALWFAGYFPFGNPYPPIAPNFEACRNQSSFVSAVIQINPDAPTTYTIRVTFEGVGHGSQGQYPLGMFYRTGISISSGSLCVPFSAKTIPWDSAYMPNPFPPVLVPSAGPGFDYPASWGCDMHLCTVTVEGLL